MVLATTLGIACNMIVFPINASDFTIREATIEGIALPKEAALYLQQRNDQIRSVSLHNISYIVGAPFITALMTNKTNNWTCFDPFAETWTEEEFMSLLGTINKQHPSLILIEVND